MAHGHGCRHQVFAGRGLRCPDLKGKYAAEHLVHDESKGVDVRLLRHGTAPDLLWLQVLQRRLSAHEIRELQLVPQAAQLYIEELELSVVAQHHISGPKTSVNVSGIVQGFEGPPELDGQAEALGDVARSRREQRAEALPRDQLRGDKGLTALGLAIVQKASERRIHGRDRGE